MGCILERVTGMGLLIFGNKTQHFCRTPSAKLSRSKVTLYCEIGEIYDTTTWQLFIFEGNDLSWNEFLK